MKKSSSYRETFRQHRKLLTLPVIVAMVIGGWFALGAPKSYQSSASLWVSIPGSASSSLLTATPPLISASSQEEGVVNELLSTKSFLLAVGHQSSLAAYLAANPSRGWGPTALLSKLGGGNSLNSQILAALGSKQITTSTAGPEVLQISYVGPTPSTAQSTLQAIVNELQVYSARFSEAHGAAQANLSQATTNLNQTGGSRSSGGNPVRVIDSASLPVGPTSGKKKVVEGILGGLFAGLLISFLGTIALTRGRSDPWEDEQEPAAAAVGRNGGPVEPENGSVALATTTSSPSSLVAGRLSVPARGSVRKPGTDAS